MSLEDWAENARDRFERDGLTTGVYGAVQELWQGGLGVLGRHVYNYGTHVYERDWDVLLVLDTCRPDVLAEVADDYDFLADYDPEADVLNSVGSRSPEWIDKTFDPESAAGPELADTAYVSANPHTRDVPEFEELYLLDEVWKYGWNPDFGTVPPENVTDRAIDVHRTHDPEHLIVHFMQPHSPYRSLVQDHPDWFSLDVGLDNPEQRPEMVIWERLRTNRISRAELWAAYRDNLRWVLDSVEELLRNMDADNVVITSDHGEAFGEWWYYGHTSTAPIPVLKRVPWAETTATDTGEYEPELDAASVRVDDDEVEDKLRNLGYV
ncbi:sulfatase-like hydrolase/transferase [Halorussus halobius]|uniref:sulfatase-like hydrolase/transferase n=1 Tax=Halorussus halobius TaxID=1710537 RepID=UPI0010923C0B|nr:sulfatase-like hydrolase/transferase [Halorussus halobius]